MLFECFATVFENHPKCRIWGFQFWRFLRFGLIKIDLSGNIVWPQSFRFFKKLSKLTTFGNFIELSSTQNARHVKCDFSCDFWIPWLLYVIFIHFELSFPPFLSFGHMYVVLDFVIFLGFWRASNAPTITWKAGTMVSSPALPGPAVMF